MDICKITPDGLHAICIVRNLDEGISKNDIINCIFEVCTEPRPWSIKTAVTDIIFFRFRYGCDMYELCPYELQNNETTEKTIDVSDYFDNYSLAPVTKADARLIGAMMSHPRQAFMRNILIDFIICIEQMHRIKPKPGYILSPITEEEKNNEQTN